MPDFNQLLTSLKKDVTQLAKDTIGDFADQAEQAAKEANNYLQTVEADLKKYAEQFASGQIDKDMLAYLLNSEQALGQMKLQTEIGLAKIKADRFIMGVKDLVLNTIITIAGTIL